MKRGKYQAIRCRAHRTDGEECNAWAMKGQLVCRVHGGSSPQAKAAAAQRISEAQVPAAAALIAQLDSESERIVQGAAKLLLDYGGTVVDVDVDEDEQIIRVTFSDRNW